MPYGFRAAIKNLQSYICKYNCNTIAAIVSKWAPASAGNNPSRYTDTVSSRSGISKSAVIAESDKDALCQIAAAMAYVENGSVPMMEDVYKGYELI